MKSVPESSSGLDDRVTSELPLVLNSKNAPSWPEYYSRAGNRILEKMDIAISNWGTASETHLPDLYISYIKAKKEMGLDLFSEIKKLESLAKDPAARNFIRREANFRLAQFHASIRETTYARQYLGEGRKQTEPLFSQAYVDVAAALYKNWEKKKSGEVFAEAISLAGTRWTSSDDRKPQIIPQVRVEDLMKISHAYHDCGLDYMPLIDEALEILAPDWNPNSRNFSFTIVTDALCEIGEPRKAFELAKSKPFPPDIFEVNHARKWGWGIVEKFIEQKDGAMALETAELTKDNFLIALALAELAVEIGGDTAPDYLDKAQKMIDLHSSDYSQSYDQELMMRKTIAYAAIGNAKSFLKMNPLSSFEQAKQMALAKDNGERSWSLTVLGEFLDESGYDGTPFYTFVQKEQQAKLSADASDGIFDIASQVYSYLNLEHLCRVEIRQGRLDLAEETLNFLSGRRDYMENELDTYIKLLGSLVSAYAQKAVGRIEITS